MIKVATLVFGLFALFYGPALSETYYVAPLGAVASGTPDGTEARPFTSIDTALKSGKVKGGDTLLLKDGAYGAVTIKANAAFDVPLTIMSQNTKSAQMDNILLSGSTRNIILRNLSVWPSDPEKGLNFLIRAYTTTSDITLDGLDVRSDKFAEGYRQWDAAKWEKRKYSGILLEGPRGVVLNSRLIGINHGILVSRESRVVGNTIIGYNGDGMRASSGSLVKGNRVYDCVSTNGNHDDGFQGLSDETAPLKNLVLDSNIILEWTGPSEHPLRCSLQGIGFFGGFHENIRIINNVVSVSAHHGISIYGVRHAVIINNTVVHSKGHTLGYPYIAVFDSEKYVSVSMDVLVANNVAMRLVGQATPLDSVIFLNNSVVGTPSLVFENPAAYDYRPKASSGFIDTGDATLAPSVDILGQKRPTGPLPDRGAYEVQTGGAPAPTPVDPAVAPSPIGPSSPAGPKRIKISIGDLGKEPQPPVLKRPPLKAGNAKRIILE